jgi:hypothetical protein
MDQVRTILRQASARLLVGDALQKLVYTATAIAGLLLLTLLVQRIFGLMFPWRTIFAGSGAALVTVTLLWSYIARRKPLEVARYVDSRADLHDLLATSLFVERNTDAWSAAVREDAARIARNLKAGDIVETPTPHRWAAPIIAGFAFAAAWMYFPLLDVLKVQEKRTAAVQQKQAVVEVKAQLEQKEEILKKALEKAKVTVQEDTKAPEKSDEEKETPEAAEPQDPESLKREAMKKLTNLTEKLEAQKEGEKAALVEAQREAMRQLKVPADGPLNDFSRALSRGDFNKAQEHLEQLTKKLADGNLTQEEKAAAKNQMENLSKQLSQMAESQGQVAKQLEKAGLDKKTAEELAKQAVKNPEVLKKAIEEMKNLSEEQKKNLAEMAKACQGACKNAGQMGEGLSKMAQGMTQDGLQQEGQEGAEQLSKELSDSEMLKEDMQNLDAALEEAKDQLASLSEGMGQGGGAKGRGKGKDGNGDGDGEGEGDGDGQGGWKPGESAGKSGSGSGGPGQSQGGMSPEAQASDFEFKKEKANTQTQGGPIIGSRLVYGEAIKGEATAEVTEAVAASTREAAEALETMQIPREYHDAVKHYFGRMQEKVKKEGAPAQPAQKPGEKPKDAPAEPAKPAPAKPAPAGEPKK